MPTGGYRRVVTRAYSIQWPGFGPWPAARRRVRLYRRRLVQARIGLSKNNNRKVISTEADLVSGPRHKTQLLLKSEELTVIHYGKTSG